MTYPKLALCNFIDDPLRLKRFALAHGFDGVDWTFSQDNLPANPQDMAALIDTISGLAPLEVRYHCFLKNTDLGDVDEQEADNAMRMLRSACTAVSAVRGKVVTIHIGLGRDSTVTLSWDRTIERLAQLVGFADSLGIRLCLENLAWGWTSRPRLFEKLLRKSGCWGTLDIGHARVSPSVTSQGYHVADFVTPHPQRFLNAHIYHEETENGHTAAKKIGEIKDRLCLLERLYPMRLVGLGTEGRRGIIADFGHCKGISRRQS